MRNGIIEPAVHMYSDLYLLIYPDDYYARAIRGDGYWHLAAKAQ